MRIQVRPASDTQAFLERMAQLCREGKVTRSGYPRPLAGAEVVRDFGHTGHAKRAAAARATRDRTPDPRRGERVAALHVVDEWDVATPPEPVFDAIADAGSYPTWWRPVYIDVEADGPPAVGVASRQHFKGRLPYHLRTTSVIPEMDAPRTITAEVDGDLRGRGTWTLTPRGERTHVRFDWQVHADRRLLRVLTPVLRPLFRWNHNWAIARAMEGLEPYARATAVPPAIVEHSSPERGEEISLERVRWSAERSQRERAG